MTHKDPDHNDDGVEGARGLLIAFLLITGGISLFSGAQAIYTGNIVGSIYPFILAPVTAYLVYLIIRKAPKR
ncbi:hypothetical protein HZC00_03885 [Candidatus Kaiserbacteria bacterium]|nr:hypothetical protein [Candidatus Kaiserbacteria bacterium]